MQNLKLIRLCWEFFCAKFGNKTNTTVHIRAGPSLFFFWVLHWKYFHRRCGIIPRQNAYKTQLWKHWKVSFTQTWSLDLLLTNMVIFFCGFSSIINYYTSWPVPHVCTSMSGKSQWDTWGQTSALVDLDCEAWWPCISHCESKKISFLVMCAFKLLPGKLCMWAAYLTFSIIRGQHSNPGQLLWICGQSSAACWVWATGLCSASCLWMQAGQDRVYLVPRHTIADMETRSRAGFMHLQYYYTQNLCFPSRRIRYGFSTIPAALPGPGALSLGYSFAFFILRWGNPVQSGAKCSDLKTSSETGVLGARKIGTGEYYPVTRVQFWIWLPGQKHRRTSPAQRWTGQDRRPSPAQKWTGQGR